MTPAEEEDDGADPLLELFGPGSDAEEEEELPPLELADCAGPVYPVAAVRFCSEKKEARAPWADQEDSEEEEEEQEPAFTDAEQDVAIDNYMVAPVDEGLLVPRQHAAAGA